MDVVSAKKIITSDNGGYYQGVMIHKTKYLLPSRTGVSYGIVAIASDVRYYETVMHEYGHFLHPYDIGLFTHTSAVAKSK